ncbi:MAG: riboflavin biosynthesis protein RibF, partial [Candidatus Omnitrophica bacterium]|nr:riboflavin biosynthesis protein RibF [Candidatus Omnitrophota bacterium]
VADFDHWLRYLSAERFIREILVEKLGIKYLIVGQGFLFGRDRIGSYAVLKKLSRIYGFKTVEIKKIKINNQIVSSTKIRALIQKGKIAQANQLLGRKFSLSGKVKQGSSRGRILGYPTANIQPEQEIIPAGGVYVVLVRLNQQIYPGILNIGHCPTFPEKKKSSPTIEVHIFNFNHQIYGNRLEVCFIKKIRSEKRFISRQALAAQIRKDELRARQILI